MDERRWEEKNNRERKKITRGTYIGKVKGLSVKKGMIGKEEARTGMKRERERRWKKEERILERRS